MRGLHDLVGQVFGRLTVVKRSSNRGKITYWECLCSCGNTRVVAAGSLVRRCHTRSCGCLSREAAKGRLITHGMTGSPEYSAYKSMRNRCYNPKVDSYPDYGARGIKVCERWSGELGFKNFLSDMGLRPRGRSLDRRNVNGDYTPENCAWATASEQMKNRRKMMSLQKFPDIEFLQELNRRFPEPEYGVSAC